MQVFAWLVAEANPERGERLLASLPKLAADPHSQATAPVRPNVLVALVPDLDAPGAHAIGVAVGHGVAQERFPASAPSHLIQRP